LRTRAGACGLIVRCAGDLPGLPRTRTKLRAEIHVYRIDIHAAVACFMRNTHNPRTQIVKLSVPLMLLVLLTPGCSRTDLLYDNADWLVYRWADRLMDASGAQEDAWRGMFRQAMLEHRRELLPQVVALLHRVEVGVRRGLTAAELSCWTEAADRVYREHARWAVLPATAVLSDLSPAQAGHLAEELQRRNRDYAEDYLDEDLQRRERRRIDRYIERVEGWTGDLTTEQLRLVEELAGRLPDSAPDWLDYRVDRQRRLLELLGGSADRGALQQFLDAWWVGLSGRPMALIDKTERIRAGVIDLLLALDGALTQGQRDRVLERLGELRDDLAGAADTPQEVLFEGQADAICVAADRAAR
jgi:hypothetical protein